MLLTLIHASCECRRISNSLSYRILLLDSFSGHFLLRSLICILFECMVFLIIQDLNSNRTQRVNVVFFENSRAANSNSSVGMMRLKEQYQPSKDYE